MWELKYDVKTIKRDDIPVGIGLYAWFSKKDGLLVYIGKATGTGGLRKRIWSQHLNPVYLEARVIKFRSKDTFQVENPIYYNGKLVIDKSAFRKNVARAFLLKAGTESLDFIKDNYLISFESFPSSDKELVAKMENELIKLHKPTLNIALK